jgi:Zn-dependent protease with chaperone function
MFDVSGMQSVFSGAKVDWAGGASKVLDFFTPDINVAVLRDTARYRELEADALQLKVEQEANLIREQFLQSVGAFQAQGARRGFKVGEGDIQKNIETSAENLSEDIQTARGSAKNKAEQLRNSASRLKQGASNYELLGYSKKFTKHFGSQKEIT